MENLELLVRELIKLDNETPWLEFKKDNDSPKMIGQDISALANSACLYEKSSAYMVWGIDNTTHEIIGTDFHWQNSKVGNEEIENWLRHQLSDNADFTFHSVEIDHKNLVILIIYKAIYRSVMFEKIDYIRVGSYTKKLNDYPTIQSQLWDRLRNSNYEMVIAKNDLSPEEAINLLDVSSYFDLKGDIQPSSLNSITHYLCEESILKEQDNGLFSITNLGAILFAKHISDFPNVSRKAIRVVQYSGNNRLNMIRESVGNKGYANGFDGLMHFLSALLPSKEVIDYAKRKTISSYPLLAIREAVANALIHQDFSITGTGPVIEIFENRIEITNPGIPLIDIMRIIDNPPKSRNEKLASLMRRLRMCEELGTGWDKIAISCEEMLLPSPKISLYNENTRVILYSTIPFNKLSYEDKLWACYLHACLKQVEGEQINNSSLRARFGLNESSSANISRLIKDAVSMGLIKPVDPNTAPRYMRYIPYWA